MDEHVGLRDAPVPADAGRGAGLRQRIISALVVAVVVRGLAWMGSLFMAGPMLGAASFAVLAESPLGPGFPVLVEAILTLFAVAAAITIAVGVRRDEPRWRRRARTFGWALVAQTVFYVGSLVVVALVWGGLSGLAELDWAIVLVAVFNVPLLLLGVSITRKSS